MKRLNFLGGSLRLLYAAAFSLLMTASCATKQFDPPPVPAPIVDPRPTPAPDPAPVVDPIDVEWPEIGKLARGLNYVQVVTAMGSAPSKPLRKVAREQGVEAASWRRQVGQEAFFAHMRFVGGRLDSWVVR